MTTAARPERGFRCSVAARERGDSRVGTAPPARRWFLVEQRGGWGPTAWAGLSISEEQKPLLEQLVDAGRGRMMLIRRPGRGDTGEKEQQSRRWFVVDAAAAQPVRTGVAHSTEDLFTAARLLGDPEAPGPEECPEPAAGTPQLLLICTHGRKDVCCAMRGRPVAARAAGRWPEAAWECSHTGGDRFSANMILLPDGACYGGLAPDDLEPVVNAHLTGRVDAAHLRGPTGWSPAVQAAMVAAYAHEPMAWGRVTPLTEQHAGDRWRVTLSVQGSGEYAVEGHLDRSEPRWLTCSGPVPKSMTTAVVDSYRPLSG